MSKALFQSHFDVSRETLDMLEAFEALLKKWQKSHNLVSNSTIYEVWQRHFLDSAQLSTHISDKNISIADLGSGGGFPCLVLSILGYTNVTSIESDMKKCLFQKQVIRELGLNTKVINKRIEDVEDTFDLIVSRALAPLETLIKYSDPLTEGSLNLLFLKGKSYKSEIKAAKKHFDFECEIYPSLTSDEAAILKVTK